ncbi:hypothetical protein PC111_g20772 [Phytophthora cactorum]|nr:hypothetical protein PC111_g20772 [Phytophthora cactorum]
MPFRFLYHKDLQNVETTDDTIIESFGKPVYGAQFQEKGYLVVRRPRAMSTRFALLQTCYLISPALPIRSLSDERSVTDD